MSKIDSIISAKLGSSESVERFFNYPQYDPKIPKNIQFSEGGQPPLKVIIFRKNFYHVICHP